MKIDIENLSNTSEILVSDVKQSLADFKKRPTSQYCRRAVIRTGISYLENKLFSYRQLALSFHQQWCELDIIKQTEEGLPHKTETFSAHELTILSETQAQLKDDGEIREIPAFYPLTKLFRFSFKSLSKALMTNISPDYSQVGWERLQKAIDIRNRITHARACEDLQISDDEMKSAKDGILWFIAQDNKVNDALLHCTNNIVVELCKLPESTKSGITNGSEHPELPPKKWTPKLTQLGGVHENKIAKAYLL